MPVPLKTFLLDIADPVTPPEKFLWKELPGDQLQIYGKSLDMKARITKENTRGYSLLLIARDGQTSEIYPLRSLEAAKKKAETLYSAWIRKSSLQQIDA